MNLKTMKFDVILKENTATYAQNPSSTASKQRHFKPLPFREYIVLFHRFAPPPLFLREQMIRTWLTGRYDNGASGVVASSSLNAGDDVVLKAKATIIDVPSLDDLSLSAEKPGSFTIDYNVPKKDVKFQFMNKARVLEKQLNWTYSHWRGDNQTVLDGTLMIDNSNKLSANYELNSRNCKVKYSYKHGCVLTLEPSYDFGKNSWDLVVSMRGFDDDVARASYQSWSKVLKLDWCRNTSMNSSLKMSASINLEDLSKPPTFTAESRLKMILTFPENRPG